MMLETVTTVVLGYEEYKACGKICDLLSNLRTIAKDYKIVNRETGQYFSDCLGECIDLLESLETNDIIIY